MSKYISQLIEDIKTNPNSWRDYDGRGIKKDLPISKPGSNIIIHGYGNTRLLSVIEVVINGNEIPISYIDRWKLEVTIKEWYKNINLSILLSKEEEKPWISDHIYNLENKQS